MVAAVLDTAAAFGSRLRRSADTINRQSVQQVYKTQATYYGMLRRYYSSEIYERADANVAAIKAWEGLPRYIRPIALVPRRAVEWWPGHVFPGAWTADGLPASNGRPNRIAYDSDVAEEVRVAAQQAFTWANGPRFLLPFVRQGAMLGNAFAEVVNDPTRNKVYPVLQDPEYIVELERNATGDVTMYRLAIPMRDPITKQGYFWGKRVTRETITTYYDDAERGYDDQDAEIPNPYGFVPAVWVSHVETGGRHGAPAIDGTLPLLDELNGLLSAVNDYIMRFVHQHVIIESPNPTDLWNKLQGTAASSRTRTDDFTDRNAKRQDIPILPAPIGTHVHHLQSNLGLSEADPHIARIEAQIEKAFPEIVLSEKLLEMTQVTRPGALPLVQDVQHKFDESAGNYYDGVAQLAEMCCTIGGYHANAGDWGLRSQLTEQQQKFLSFGLDSWSSGDVSVSITPGELLPRSMSDLITEAAGIESLRTPTSLRHIGLSDDDIYGEGVEPPERRGLLEEQQGGANTVTSIFGQAFDAGRIT